jgi:hypothetical protein
MGDLLRLFRAEDLDQIKSASHSTEELFIVGQTTGGRSQSTREVTRSWNRPSPTAARGAKASTNRDPIRLLGHDWD